MPPSDRRAVLRTEAEGCNVQGSAGGCAHGGALTALFAPLPRRHAGEPVKCAREMLRAIEAYLIAHVGYTQFRANVPDIFSSVFDVFSCVLPVY